jgi:hypothetical protein
MSQPVITWYRHAHENRNDLLRYGLMQLHQKGEINYIEKNLDQANESNFSELVFKASNHRHLSFIEFNQNDQSKKIIVDSEDSFVQLSELIKEADLYFTASYSSSLFKKKEFPNVFDWQSDSDLQWYRGTVKNLIKNLGHHFFKIRPFIPIAPNLAYPENRSFIKKQITNIYHRFYKLITGRNYWVPHLRYFDKRYSDLKKMRLNELEYDIVINDTLWGWPKHRINLHIQLGHLEKVYKIRSILKWHKPYIEDGSDMLNLSPKDFPIIVGEITDNYEAMLSKSKLGVFSIGFHWGWRNIMTLAMFFGIPILADKPLLEPYFDFDEFKLFYNESHEWITIKTLLDSITPDKWYAMKVSNQKVYDQYLSPVAVAQYFITTIVNE